MMHHLLNKTTAVAVAVVFALTLFFAPSSALAAWHDNSDDLPGTDSNVGTVIIIGAVVVVGIVTYALIKHHGNSNDRTTKAAPETESTTPAVSEPEGTTDESVPAADTTQVVPTSPQEDSRFNLYFGVTDDRELYHGDDRAWDFSDMTLRAGVTIGF